MIAKTFISAKTFRSHSANFFARIKVLTIMAIAELPDVIRRHASALMHHESL